MSFDAAQQAEFVGQIARHQAALHASIISLMPGMDGGDEVLQETNVVPWEKRLSGEPRTNFRAYQVTEVLDRLVRGRGKPKSLRCDNGPEFAGRMLDQWAYLNGVEIDFSRPGKPTDNAYIEAFNARLRAECLNASWFLSMADARDRIEAWRID